MFSPLNMLCILVRILGSRTTASRPELYLQTGPKVIQVDWQPVTPIHIPAEPAYLVKKSRLLLTVSAHFFLCIAFLVTLGRFTLPHRS
jgi:hypothetical protein